MKPVKLSEAEWESIVGEVVARLGHPNVVSTEDFNIRLRYIDRQIRKLASQADLEVIEDQCDHLDSEVASLAYMRDHIGNLIDARIAASLATLAELIKPKEVPNVG